MNRKRPSLASVITVTAVGLFGGFGMIALAAVGQSWLAVGLGLAIIGLFYTT